MATLINKLAATENLSNRLKATELIRQTTGGKQLTDEQIRIISQVVVPVKGVFTDKTGGVFTGDPGTVTGGQGTVTGGQGTVNTAPEQEKPDLEIDTKLQILISSIPRANPGDIIGSEYHNSLREAIRGIASRIGLSVSAASEFRILTFSPAFLPTVSKTPNAPNQNWEVTLNRTGITSAIDVNRPVSGGFVVQLP